MYFNEYLHTQGALIYIEVSEKSEQEKNELLQTMIDYDFKLYGSVKKYLSCEFWIFEKF